MDIQTAQIAPTHTLSLRDAQAAIALVEDQERNVAAALDRLEPEITEAQLLNGEDLAALDAAKVALEPVRNAEARRPSDPFTFGANFGTEQWRNSREARLVEVARDGELASRRVLGELEGRKGSLKRAQSSLASRAYELRRRIEELKPAEAERLAVAGPRASRLDALLDRVAGR